MRSHATAALLVCAAFALGNVGCMRGMTYKMAMPESMTLGTVKDEEASLASARQPAPPKIVARAPR